MDLTLQEGKIYKTGDGRRALIKKIHREFEAYVWVEADLITEDGEVVGKATYHLTGRVGMHACPMDIIGEVHA